MPLHLGLPKLREAMYRSSAPQAGRGRKNKHICSSTDAQRSKIPGGGCSLPPTSTPNSSPRLARIR